MEPVYVALVAVVAVSQSVHGPPSVATCTSIAATPLRSSTARHDTGNVPPGCVSDRATIPACGAVVSLVNLSAMAWLSSGWAPS